MSVNYLRYSQTQCRFPYSVPYKHTVLTKSQEQIFILKIQSSSGLDVTSVLRSGNFIMFRNLKDKACNSSVLVRVTWLKVAARFDGPGAGVGQALRGALLGCDLGPAEFHIQGLSDGPGPLERRV